MRDNIIDVSSLIGFVLSETVLCVEWQMLKSAYNIDPRSSVVTLIQHADISLYLQNCIMFQT